ncbi:MAG: thiol-disulfide oxidoreductase DCC family protein [Bacteroidota bacterium]
MFTKLHSTEYPPKDKPLMAWDGNCGFCHYWVIKWKKMTGERVNYQPFQQIHKEFPDIDYRLFKQAIRLIDTDGRIYTGPAAVFHALNRYSPKWRWVMPLYRNIRPFRFLADHFYAFVSRHRVKMYEVVIRLFGKNPARPKNYWIYYLLLLLIIIGMIIFL